MYTNSRREASWSSGRVLALDAARPRSIPGLGGENNVTIGYLKKQCFVR